jgi:hypothetical protein
MGESLHAAAEAFYAESRALDATVAELSQLMTNPGPDLAPQFKQFSRGVDRLQGAAKRADQSIKVMHDRRTAYFAAWDAELAAMNYGIIRERSEGRLSVVSNHVDNVLQRYEETQGVVRPMVTYLDDLRRALSADLTIEGLQAVRDIAANAEVNARKVQQGLVRITEELGDSRSRISRHMVPNEEAEIQAANAGEDDHRRIR